MPVDVGGSLSNYMHHYYFVFYFKVLTSQTTLTMVLMKKAGTPTIRNSQDSMQLINYTLESW